MTTIIEGEVNYRDRNSWHRRYCVLKKNSRVADGLHLFMFKDKRQRMEAHEISSQVKESNLSNNYHPPNSPPLGAFLSESGIQIRLGYLDLVYGCFYGLYLHQKQWTILFVCEGGVHCVSLDTIDELTAWRNVLQAELRDKQFYVRLVHADSKSRLPKNTSGWLIVQPSRICFFSEPRKKKGFRRIFSRTRPQSGDYSHGIDLRPSSTSIPNKDIFNPGGLTSRPVSAMAFPSGPHQTNVLLSNSVSTNSEDPRLLMVWPLTDLALLKAFRTDDKLTSYLSPSDNGEENHAYETAPTDLLKQLAQNRMVRRMAQSKPLNFFSLIGANRPYSKGVGLHIFYAPEAQRLFQEVSILTKSYFPPLVDMFKSLQPVYPSFTEHSLPDGSLESSMTTATEEETSGNEPDCQGDNESEWPSSKQLNECRASSPVYDMASSPEHVDETLFESTIVPHSTKTFDENEVFRSLENIQQSLFHASSKSPTHSPKESSSEDDTITNSTTSTLSQVNQPADNTQSDNLATDNTYRTTKKTDKRSTHNATTSTHSSPGDTMSLCCGGRLMKTSSPHRDDSTDALVLCDEEGESIDSASVTGMNTSCETGETELERMSLTKPEGYQSPYVYMCGDILEDEAKHPINKWDQSKVLQPQVSNYDDFLKFKWHDCGNPELTGWDGICQREKHNPYGTVRRHTLNYANRFQTEVSPQPGVTEENESRGHSTKTTSRRRSLGDSMRALFRSSSMRYRSANNITFSVTDPAQIKTKKALFFGSIRRRRAHLLLEQTSARGTVQQSNSSPQTPVLSRRPLGHLQQQSLSPGHSPSEWQTHVGNVNHLSSRSPNGLSSIQQRSLPPAPATSQSTTPKSPRNFQAFTSEFSSSKASSLIPPLSLHGMSNDYVEIDITNKMDPKSSDSEKHSPNDKTPSPMPTAAASSSVNEEDYNLVSQHRNAIYITPPTSPMSKNTPFSPGFDTALPPSNVGKNPPIDPWSDAKVKEGGSCLPAQSNDVYVTIEKTNTANLNSKDQPLGSSLNPESAVLRGGSSTSTTLVYKSSRHRVYSESSAANIKYNNRTQELLNERVYEPSCSMNSSNKLPNSRRDSSMQTLDSSPRFSRSFSMNPPVSISKQTSHNNDVRSYATPSIGRQRYQSVSYMTSKPRSGSDYDGYIRTTSQLSNNSPNTSFATSSVSIAPTNSPQVQGISDSIEFPSSYGPDGKVHIYVNLPTLSNCHDYVNVSLLDKSNSSFTMPCREHAENTGKNNIDTVDAPKLQYAKLNPSRSRGDNKGQTSPSTGQMHQTHSRVLRPNGPPSEYANLSGRDLSSSSSSSAADSAAHSPPRQLFNIPNREGRVQYTFLAPSEDRKYSSHGSIASSNSSYNYLRVIGPRSEDTNNGSSGSSSREVTTYNGTYVKLDFQKMDIISEIISKDQRPEPSTSSTVSHPSETASHSEKRKASRRNKSQHEESGSVSSSLYLPRKSSLFGLSKKKI